MPLPARPRISLLAPPLVPGRTATVTVVLDAKRATRIDFVDLVLHGFEGGPNHFGRTATRLGARLRPAGQLEMGRTELPCRIDVPPTLTPTYDGMSYRVRHEADVHVSIPYWPDARASFQLVVRPPPRAPRTWDGLLFSSASGGAPVSGPYAEVSLATRSTSPGAVLTGAIALYNVASSGYDKVVVALRQIERVGTWTHVAASWQIEIAGSRFYDGQRVDFSLRVPQLSPSMQLGNVDLVHDVLITARSRWGELLHMPIPIEVLPDAVEPSLRAAPPLGDQRMRALWERVAAQYGFALEDEALVRRVEGRVVLVRRQLTGRRPLLVAEVRHPPLGLSLRCAKRLAPRWLGAGGPATGVDLIDDELAFEARGERQAAAYLAHFGGQAWPALSGAMVLNEIADDHVSVALADSGTTEAPIAAAARAALALDAWAAVPSRVPLPPPLDAEEARWTEMVARLGGTLERGSGTVTATFEDAEIGIRPAFDERGEARKVRVSRREATPLDVASPLVSREAAAFAVWRDEARRAAERLLDQKGELAVSADEVAFTATLSDWPEGELAARTERLASDLSRLAAALRPARGPFR